MHATQCNEKNIKYNNYELKTCEAGRENPAAAQKPCTVRSLARIDHVN